MQLAGEVYKLSRSIFLFFIELCTGCDGAVFGFLSVVTVKLVFEGSAEDRSRSLFYTEL